MRAFVLVGKAKDVLKQVIALGYIERCYPELGLLEYLFSIPK